jgi:hypothetical protein
VLCHAPEGGERADDLHAGDVLERALHQGDQEGLAALLVQRGLVGQPVEAVRTQVAVECHVQLRVACDSVRRNRTCEHMG